MILKNDDVDFIGPHFILQTTEMSVYIHALRIARENGEVIYPVLLNCEAGLILVDSGYPGELSLIENGASILGLDLSNLTAVIVSHHEIDHIGG